MKMCCAISLAVLLLHGGFQQAHAVEIKKVGAVQTPNTEALLKAGDEPVTVVCFGDSVTGVYYHTGGLRAYPDMVEIALKRIHPKAKVKVINAGISGHTTKDALARIKKDVLDHKPTLVTIMFGLNDMVRVPLPEFSANLKNIIGQCRAIGAETLLCTPNSIYDSGSRPIDTLEKYVAAIHGVGKQENVAVAGCYEAYESIRIMDHLAWAMLMSEAIHPNMYGHKRNAQEIAAAITGKMVSLKDVEPLMPAIPRTLSLIKTGKPVKVYAMPPYDQLIGPALKRIDPSAQAEVTTWNVEGMTLPEIEASSKKVREMGQDLVLVAVPLTATADSTEHFIRSYSWVLNWSIHFAHRQWDFVGITPGVALIEMDEDQQRRDRFDQELIKASDLPALTRKPGDTTPPDELLAQWLKAQAEYQVVGEKTSE
jgi:lysophospholipase L1-like esterase